MDATRAAVDAGFWLTCMVAVCAVRHAPAMEPAAQDAEEVCFALGDEGAGDAAGEPPAAGAGVPGAGVSLLPPAPSVHLVHLEEEEGTATAGDSAAGDPAAGEACAADGAGEPERAADDGVAGAAGGPWTPDGSDAEAGKVAIVEIGVDPQAVQVTIAEVQPLGTFLAPVLAHVGVAPVQDSVMVAVYAVRYSLEEASGQGIVHAVVQLVKCVEPMRFSGVPVAAATAEDSDSHISQGSVMVVMPVEVGPPLEEQEVQVMVDIEGVDARAALLDAGVVEFLGGSAARATPSGRNTKNSLLMFLIEFFLNY